MPTSKTGPARGVLGLKMAAQGVPRPILSKMDVATGLEGKKRPKNYEFGE